MARPYSCDEIKAKVTVSHVSKIRCGTTALALAKNHCGVLAHGTKTSLPDQFAFAALRPNALLPPLFQSSLPYSNGRPV